MYAHSYVSNKLATLQVSANIHNVNQLDKTSTIVVWLRILLYKVMYIEYSIWSNVKIFNIIGQ